MCNGMVYVEVYELYGTWIKLNQFLLFLWNTWSDEEGEYSVQEAHHVL